MAIDNSSARAETHRQLIEKLDYSTTGKNWSSEEVRKIVVQLVEEIAAARNLAPADVQELIDQVIRDVLGDQHSADTGQ